ncbi:DNA-directed RNA polymerase subunit alpha [Candidatus Woesebacteria bacterium RIFCSPLOWO2_01_FULL_37_19]|uniref:DNA-directed RNA polymerase subunit alpha n=2 Tax=Candidatus Woeseibacteriota TaxID=1752722 RepID=A0A1F8B2A0_9BACT|nr:MAG: DNA-directed RNA polymerase subunit alpha [Candidatus Woesebacteria bacterium RIFCSPHIGHO2_01_FULL_38_26b]OGM58122.1 MAG: DNA-directed RNA polymerase subunit alpha [Candidatus Woesebacteria bacterium RIFCSPLOWO2_01_FULL_37_19]
MSEPIFEINTQEKTDNYAKFVISPLEQGYGITLGNSLRRVLLTNLPGAAISSVRISGVKHQFSSLKGMKEDMVEFLLNLKKVRFSYQNNKPTKATLHIDKAGDVKAGDIKTEPTVKVINPDLVLSYLNKGSKLDAKMEIEIGVGYSPSEDRATGEIGLIPLDGVFSPVTRVNYKVEETRVGRLTNYDKLLLEVWTDGTIEPADALVNAAKILVSYYNQVVSPKEVKKEEVEMKDELGVVGKLSVEEIGLPTRVANALLKAGYESVEDLVKANRDNLVKVRNLGEKSVKIIEAALGEKGLAIIG